MKILTWNLNGIRSFKEPLKVLLDSLDADIICLQETKVTRDQLDDTVAIAEGYNSYFSFSRVRSGYSGVATFCKNHVTPFKAEDGLTGLKVDADSVGCYGDQSDFTEKELKALDNEGRCVITQHKISHANRDQVLTIINVYCPRADPDKPDRLTFKLQFYELLQRRAEELLKNGSHVIVLGDVNTSHRPIDHCDPDADPEFLNQPGRKWMDQFLYDSNKPTADNDKVTEKAQGGHFIDTFRLFHPDQIEAFTCWTTLTSARQTNYGTRIDYIFTNIDLAQTIFKDCVIRPDIFGSDHCPVVATLNCEEIAATRCPHGCVKYLPELAGKQKKLSAFFKKGDKNSVLSAFDKLPVSEGSEVTSKSSVKRSLSRDDSATKRVKTNGKSQTSVMNFFTKKPNSLQPKVAIEGNGCERPCQESHRDPHCLVSIQGISEVSSQSASQCTLDDLSQTSSCESSQSLSQESMKSTDSVDRVLTLRQDTSTDSQKDAGSAPVKSAQKSVSNQWKELFKGPPPAPKCKGHNEPCVLRTVKKETLNKGRQFWVCARPQGQSSNKEARCDFFLWVEKKKGSGQKLSTKSYLGHVVK